MGALKNLFVSSSLRKKIGIVLLVLLIYKVGTHISVPGVNSSVLENISQDGGVLGFANTLTGGALINFSVFAVGIMPYITASIVIQLLAMDIVPVLTKWTKEGERGRKKTKNLTRISTVVIGFIQSLVMSFGFNNIYPGLVPNASIGKYLMIACFLTLGTVILMALGELIDKKGIGNGISIIIFAGIVLYFPNSIAMYYATEVANAGDMLFIAIVKTVLIVVFILFLMLAILYIHKGERRIPIKYSQIVSEGMNGNNTSFLPMKINSAGVIPVIFASAFVMIPSTVIQFASDNDTLNAIARFLDYTTWSGMIFYGLIIIFFTYFYAFIQVNPEKMAQDLKASGGFIPGIRPGKSTENYIKKVLTRLTSFGSVFLAVIAVIPIIVGQIAGLPQSIQVGGTALIIIVSVALDTSEQIKVQLVRRNFKGFMNN